MRERETQIVGRARRRAATPGGGFSAVEMLVTVALVAIIATFGAMGIASARTSMHVQTSARTFAAYVEKARADAIRRHGEATVEILSEGATSYVVTMDFNLDGVVSADEARTITLESDVHINHTATKLTFDWRGRLTDTGLSLSFEGPDGKYPVQLDVTGSGDVTIGEEKFLDTEVAEVTLHNGAGATGGINGDVSPLPPFGESGTTPPPTDPSTPPPTDPSTPPPTDPSTPPPTDPSTPPPPNPPGNGTPGGGNDKKNDPPTTPPSPPPPTTPPSPPPTTPPACTMSVSASSITIKACTVSKKTGAISGCGSQSVTVTLTNPVAGVAVTFSKPDNLTVTAGTPSGNSYPFTIAAKNDTRTDNTVTFTAISCGSADVKVKTN